MRSVVILTAVVGSSGRGRSTPAPTSLTLQVHRRSSKLVPWRRTRSGALNHGGLLGPIGLTCHRISRQSPQLLGVDFEIETIGHVLHPLSARCDQSRRLDLLLIW